MHMQSQLSPRRYYPDSYRHGNHSIILEIYDYVVIGGGTADLTMASWLVEDLALCIAVGEEEASTN